MKSVKVVVARPIKVVQNTVNKGNQWGRIRCAETGKVLHTGQLPYIKRIAKIKYNHFTSFV